MTASPIPAPAGSCPSRERPVDMIHLARQTGGSRQIESEVLALMARQIAQALQRSAEADRRTIAQLAHAITGAARNLGAFPLARVAQTLENQPDDAASLASFRQELHRAFDFIARLDDTLGRVDASGRTH